jgi:hypothetical protein
MRNFAKKTMKTRRRNKILFCTLQQKRANMMGGDNSTDSVSTRGMTEVECIRVCNEVLRDQQRGQAKIQEDYDNARLDRRVNRNPPDETMWCPIEPGVSSTCKHEFGDHFCTTCGIRAGPQHVLKVSERAYEVLGIFFCVKCRDIRRSIYCGVCGGKNKAEPRYDEPSVSVAALTRVLLAFLIRYLGMFLFVVMCPNLFSLFAMFVVDALVLGCAENGNLKPLYFGRILDGVLTARLFASFVIWMLAFFLMGHINDRDMYPGLVTIPYKTPLWNGVFVSHLMIEIFVPLLLVVTSHWPEHVLSLKK